MIALTHAAVVGEDINGVFVRTSMETSLPYMGIKYVRAITHTHIKKIKNPAPSSVSVS